MTLISGITRRVTASAIRALEEELAGGPTAVLPADLEQIGRLVHEREERAHTKEGPEREILSALSDPAALVAQDGRVRVSNAALDALAPGARAVGLTPLEITGSTELDLAVRRALEGSGRRFEYETVDRKAWLAQVTPVLTTEVLLVVRDVTEVKRAEAIRRDFVANASHEMRTPVTAIRGAADTLLGGALADPEASRRFVEMIARHADRLSRLTRDLLDLSRLESGLWSMRFTEIELLPLVDSVLDLHAERAAEKGLRLAHEVPPGLAARGDERALEQVLVNLVDNAIKYTPSGGAVVVRADTEDRWVSISVQDTGPGIDPAHLPRVFERFYRADPGRSRDQGGTGLGLAIVKHLTHAQGGVSGVDSGTHGSRFWIKLPRPATDEQP